MCWSNRSGADALPALTAYLRDAGAQVVLTGSQAETGEGSGMLPFLLAESLGWPLVVGLAQVESIDGSSALVLQALPRGQRRRLKVRLPFLATVDNAAPKPRQSAYGPARRGVLQADEVEVVDDELLAVATLQPAKPRPKRLKVIKAKSGADRMKAATAKASGGGGQVLKGVDGAGGGRGDSQVADRRRRGPLTIHRYPCGSDAPRRRMRCVSRHSDAAFVGAASKPAPTGCSCHRHLWGNNDS